MSHTTVTTQTLRAVVPESSESSLASTTVTTVTNAARQLQDYRRFLASVEPCAGTGKTHMIVFLSSELTPSNTSVTSVANAARQLQEYRRILANMEPNAGTGKTQQLLFSLASPDEWSGSPWRLLVQGGRTAATMNVVQGPLLTVMIELEQLRVSPAEDETPATEHAVMSAVRALSEALTLLKLSSLREFLDAVNPYLGTDDIGGIRVAWRRGHKGVRLNFGATEKNRTYLYYEDSSSHGITDITGNTVSEKLHWLLS